MSRVCFFWWGFLLARLAGAHIELPTWLADNPGFRHPEEVNSEETGSGTMSAAGKGNLGWLVGCNKKEGYGIEVELTKVSLEPDSEEFVLIAPWPSTGAFKQMKLFTGRLETPPKKLRIPNTKAFQVLYSASRESSMMALKYRRYGTALEIVPRPTDNPVKKRETLFEVQLTGKPPTEYSNSSFSSQFKTALRSIARRYANTHHIRFDDSIPTQEMVLIHRVSFCPLEWPSRDTCASLEHSIFVSGVRGSHEDFISDYQLTADHLKNMWTERDFPELSELGVTVFLLPQTSRTVLYWSLFILLMAGFSLVGIFVFWKSKDVVEASLRKSSVEGEVKKARRPKLSLGKQQRIPSFMQAQGPESGEDVKEEVRLRERFGGVSKPEDSSQLPIKNYFGSILFGSNRAFEDDEEDPLELHPMSPTKSETKTTAAELLGSQKK